MSLWLQMSQVASALCCNHIIDHSTSSMSLPTGGSDLQLHLSCQVYHVKHHHQEAQQATLLSVDTVAMHFGSLTCISTLRDRSSKISF